MDEGVETRRLRGSLESKLFGVQERPLRLGRFSVLETLGAGGMGTVYLAYDPELDRRVALKVIQKGISGSQSLQARLHKEAQLMAKLKHPNVATIHDVGAVGHQLYLAMEYAERGTLADWCRENSVGSRAHFEEVLSFALQAANGLAAAHEVGLVHRDFKPANALIANDGRLLIADFGLAQLTNGGGSSPSSQSGASIPEFGDAATLSRTGTIAGTPAYMAPEQFKGIADARSDQFSYCLAFYEAFYGVEPFPGDTLAERRSAMRRGQLNPPPREHGAPGWLRPILQRGLLADPDDRHESMVALVAAIEAKRRPWWWLRAAGIAVVAGGVAFAFGRTGEGSQLAIPCDDGAESFGDSWAQSRRQAIRDAFARSDLGNPAQAEGLVLGRLEAFVSKWTAAHLDVCQTLRDTAPEAHQRAQTCLAQSKSAFVELSDALATGQTETMRRAVDVSLSLPRLERCRDPDPLRLATQSGTIRYDDPDVQQILADLQRASVLLELGRLEEAESLVASALGIAIQRDFAPLVARAHLEQWRAEFARGRYSDCKASALESLAAAERGAAPEDIARAWYRVASAEIELGEHDAALFELERAKNFTRREAAHPWLRAAIVEVGGKALERRGDFSGALAKYEEALALFSAIDDGQTKDAQRIFTTLGMVLTATGDCERALEVVERAAEVCIELRGDEHHSCIPTLSNRARVQLQCAGSASGLEAADEALAIANSNPWYRPESRGRLLLVAAQALSGLGRFAESRQRLELALEIGNKEGDSGLRLADVAQDGLAHLARDSGEYEECAERFDAIVKRFAASKTVRPINSSIARQSLAVCMARTGRAAEALPIADRALADLKADVDANSTWMHQALQRVGTVHLLARKHASAERIFQTLLSSAKATGTSMRIATAHRGLGEVAAARGDRAAAIRHGEEALAALESDPEAAALAASIRVWVEEQR